MKSTQCFLFFRCQHKALDYTASMVVLSALLYAIARLSSFTAIEQLFIMLFVLALLVMLLLIAVVIMLGDWREALRRFKRGY